MNVILFDNAEIISGQLEQKVSVRLPCRDYRSIHLLKTLHKKKGDCFDAGVIDGKAVLWKNEEIQNLANQGGANSIFVVKK